MEIKKSTARLWSKLGSRAVFGMALLDMAERGVDFYAMSADLVHSSGLGRFQEKFPERCINMGIAEQNMLGVAGGMAKDGTPIFATSFAPFITMRAAEQVRMNMGYMQLNVKTVGLGSGLIMAQLGNSHFGIEDVAVMRAIPNITVVSPADCGSIVKTVEEITHHKGPVYLRLTGGPGNPVVYSEEYDFVIGKAITLREGADVAIVAVGTMVHTALAAAEMLGESGLSVQVVDMHTIKPLDTNCLDGLLSHRLLVTVEEHTVCGGLGGAVAEYLAPKAKRPPHLLIGIADEFPHTGSYDYMLKACGLTAEQIATRIRTAIDETA